MLLEQQLTSLQQANDSLKVWCSLIGIGFGSDDACMLYHTIQHKILIVKIDELSQSFLFKVYVTSYKMQVDRAFSGVFVNILKRGILSKFSSINILHCMIWPE